MSDQTTEIQTKRISPTGVVVGVLASLLLLGWLVMRGEARLLKPIRPTATPGSANLNSQPIVVTFEQLNSGPATFSAQRIRVTGNYVPQPEPDCFDYTGPVISWALISGNLQLNGAGFKRVLRLVPPNTTLTVDGIWALYDGPTGCGKGAARAQTWYLQIERIVQPNPLPNSDPATDGGEPGPGATTLSDDPTPTPAGGSETAVSPTPNPALPTLPSSATDTPNPLATATPRDAATATPDSTGTTPTPAGNRPTEPPAGSATAVSPTPTPLAGSATPTASSPSTPGTSTPPPPPLATSTPGPSPTPGSGYPGPTEPPPTEPPPTPGTPTPTPKPY